MEQKLVYTVAEVADILGVNQNKVHQMRELGILPFMRLGRYKLRAESLELFLAEMEGRDVDQIISEKEKSNGNC